jgi:hypothetical protein
VTRRRLVAILSAAGLAPAAETQRVLDPAAFHHYVDEFGGDDKEDEGGVIKNAQAWDWMVGNVPFLACPDREIERTYYFRWWTYRKHIHETPDGFLITEFLKKVNHAGEYNSLSCALGHHIAEGRWLRDPRYLDQDIHFWLRGGENGGLRKNYHQFSGWTAAALYDRYLADGRRDFLLSYLDPLILDYTTWERERLTDSGLFWQRDVSDGMEESISGGRHVKNLRPSINSYMYGNAKSIAAIAALAGKGTVAREYTEKASRLKTLVQERLWSSDAAFFETLLESGQSAAVRENIGFAPWYFDLPDERAEYAVAWKQLMDPKGFLAPFGPTTAERRHPEFKIAYSGDDCQWNGPSWPFATAITLRAMANLLNNYRQDAVSKQDYFRIFDIYTRSQRLKLDDGRVIPWVDENQNPITGEWLARARKKSRPSFYGRGDYYNHSTYCDLVITGLVGLRPIDREKIEVKPLAPSEWDWFCLDRVPYHGRTISIVFDRTGKRFGKGKGLRVLSA